MEVVICLPATTKHIGEHRSQQYSRRILLKILSSIWLLARQALALGGHNDNSNGNLIQLLKLQGGEDSEILEWLQKKANKYTFPEIQNDLIKLMALHVTRNISDQLQKSPFISILIDESADITNQEQGTIVMHRNDEDFEVYEEFLGLCSVSSIDGATLLAVIKDTILRLNLSLSKLRGQCYDGCSTMSGIQPGLANSPGRNITSCFH